MTKSTILHRNAKLIEKLQQERGIFKNECQICANETVFAMVYENCFHGTESMICMACGLNMRLNMHDKRCCYCKKDSPHCIIEHRPSDIKPYEEYRKKDLIYDQTKQVYHTSNLSLREARKVFDFSCPKCQASFKTKNQLKEHVKKVHKLQYCSLCLDNRKVLLKDQILYTQHELRNHKLYGSSDSVNGKLGRHPRCLFCKKDEYNDEDLIFHMMHTHEQCHLCKKEGHKLEFYKDYDCLRGHFQEDHVPCPFQECIDSHFVVFSSQLDLNNHLIKVHASNLSRKEKDQIMKSTDFFSDHGRESMSARGRRVSPYPDSDARSIRFVGATPEYLNWNAQPISNKKEKLPKNTNSNNPEKKFKYTPTGAFTQKRRDLQTSMTNESAGEDKKVKAADLTQKIGTLLSKKKFDEFISQSQKFQSGGLLASEYYQYFISVLGKHNPQELLKDLIYSLPDETRAEALRTASRGFESKEFNRLPTASEHKRSSVQDQSQLLQEDFPSLNNQSNAGTRLGSWGGVNNSLISSNRRKKKKKLSKRDIDEMFPTLEAAPSPKAKKNEWEGIPGFSSKSRRKRK